MKLTETQIRALKPREKLYRVADGHGLTLEVTPNGSELWRYRYSWAGKEQMLALGEYPLTGFLLLPSFISAPITLLLLRRWLRSFHRGH